MNDTSTILQLPEYDFDTTNGSMCFSDHKGSNIVLYFYPKDNTSGCTQESVDFKEYHNEFQKQNCVILGISRDSIKSHQKFIDKYELPFTLISDPDEQICTHFDVMKLKNMYGKQYRGIERSTFLIGLER